MHTEHDVKINGGGDSAVDKKRALENVVYHAIMELPKESLARVLGKYLEKYGMET